jgi:hypothetical protein
MEQNTLPLRLKEMTPETNPKILLLLQKLIFLCQKEAAEFQKYFSKKVKSHFQLTHGKKLTPLPFQRTGIGEV